MATTAATLAIKVTSDATAATRDLDAAAGKVGRFESGMSKAAVGAAAVGAGLIAFGKQAFDAASDAEQAGGAVDAVFGRSAKAIHKWAEGSADSAGLATGEYEDMASKFGAQLKNMGVASKKLAPTTDELIKLGADLAAQYGGSTADAVDALGSLMRGETDPIEKYGVSIKQADIEAKKAAMGLAGLTGKADKSADMQARLALLTEQTASAHGAFAREANTASGAQQRASANWRNAQAALGTALLPVMSKAATIISKLSKLIEDNAGAFQILIGVLGGAAVAIWAVNAAMAANPITLIIAGVAALIAGIVLLVKNWDKVTAAFKWFWNWLKQNWPKLLAIISGPFGIAVLLIIKNWKKITAVFKRFGRFAGDILRRVRDVAVAAFRKVQALVRTVMRAVGDAVKKARDVAVAAFRRVRDIATAVFRAVRDVARTVFTAIRDVVRRVLDSIRDAIRRAGDVAKAVWRAIREVAATVWGAIRDKVRDVLTAIREAFSKAKELLNNGWRSIRDVARAVWDAIKGFIQWPIDKINDLVSAIKNTLNPVWATIKAAADAALSPIRTALDALKSAVQWVLDKIPSIKFPSPPGWLKAITPLSMVPPAGPAPAPAVAGVQTARAGTRTVATGGVTINVTGALDPDAVARQIQRILVGRARRVGGVRRAG